MIEVTGIDHIYIAVSDLAVSEQFYDLVLVHALGFRKNAFALGRGVLFSKFLEFRVHPMPRDVTALT